MGLTLRSGSTQPANALLWLTCAGSGSKQLANVLLWPPPVPADSFLGGSSVRFGAPKRLRSGSRQRANVLLWPPPVPADCFLGGAQNAPQRLQTACKRAAVATTCGGRLFFLGVQVCRLAGLKSSAAAQTACKRAVATTRAGRLFSWRFKCVAAPHSLQTCCCGQQLCRQTFFLGFKCAVWPA